MLKWIIARKAVKGFTGENYIEYNCKLGPNKETSVDIWF